MGSKHEALGWDPNFAALLWNEIAVAPAGPTRRPDVVVWLVRGTVCNNFGCVEALRWDPGIEALRWNPGVRRYGGIRKMSVCECGIFQESI